MVFPQPGCKALNVEQNYASNDLYSDMFYINKSDVAMLLSFETLKGAQWPSGRVLDSRRRGSEVEPHWLHCVVVFEQDTFILA